MDGVRCVWRARAPDREELPLAALACWLLQTSPVTHSACSTVNYTASKAGKQLGAHAAGGWASLGPGAYLCGATVPWMRGVEVRSRLWGEYAQHGE